jgi:Flp pilus assembly pilin Flp
MSAIDEVVATLQTVIDELNDANTAAGTARSEADDAVAQAVALGATHVVAGLSAVKDSINKLTQQIGATVDIAHDAVGHAKALADGT